MGVGEGCIMVGKMTEDRLGLEPWDFPEERKRLVGEALERWDEGVLEEGVWAFLVRTRKKPDREVPPLVRFFVRWLALQGRRWPALEAGDIRAYLLWIKEHGFPGGTKGPLAWNTVERARGALGHLFRFLEWAGHPMPPHVEYPPRFTPYVQSRRPLTEAEWARLWALAEAYTPAYWRPLLQVLLVLVGEVGLTAKEVVGLWRADLQGERLLVRGERLREVPLSPLARQVLEAWLPLRDYLASHQPLPYPQLLLSPGPRKGKGKPLSYDDAKWLLKELARLAGMDAKRDRARGDLLHRLRWRAIRNYLQAGHPKEKVAYWTGMRSLLIPGWGEG
ncbi:recombinase XerD (plasmid) [Thermus brockianus]|uniref:Recombinase XerD n=2 Tax=Thermus brockianus TaxID=56956 RepID=A0ABN6NL62_THEBO|nr:recombinase XerD [Thermus brockianus]